MATTIRKPSQTQYKQMALARKGQDLQWYTTAKIGEDDYIRISAIWRELRETRLKHDDYKCHKCGAAYNLQVHHTRYPEVWGEEIIDDLVTLCDECHKNTHKKED